MSDLANDGCCDECKHRESGECSEPCDRCDDCDMFVVDIAKIRSKLKEAQDDAVNMADGVIGFHSLRLEEMEHAGGECTYYEEAAAIIAKYKP